MKFIRRTLLGVLIILFILFIVYAGGKLNAEIKVDVFNDNQFYNVTPDIPIDQELKLNECYNNDKLIEWFLGNDYSIVLIEKAETNITYFGKLAAFGSKANVSYVLFQDYYVLSTQSSTDTDVVISCVEKSGGSLELPMYEDYKGIDKVKDFLQ